MFKIIISLPFFYYLPIFLSIPLLLLLSVVYPYIVAYIYNVKVISPLERICFVSSDHAVVNLMSAFEGEYVPFDKLKERFK